jgi:hypothetical protein
MTVTGTGAVTWSGGYELVEPLLTDPVFKVSNFTGTFASVGSKRGGEITITGVGTNATNLSVGDLMTWRETALARVTAGSPTLDNWNNNNTSPPAGVGTGSWLVDLCEPANIPTSLSTPSTVVSKTSTTVTMSQNGLHTSIGCGSGLGTYDSLGTYAAAPFSDTSSGSTSGFLHPLTEYPNSSNTTPQELSESGSSSSGFLTTALAQLRSAKPRLPMTPTTGITSVAMYNLGMSSAATTLHVKP